MSVVELKSRHQICCLRSTSTGTRRVVRPSGWGVVNSLARRGCGPVGLVHTQKVRYQSEKPTYVSCVPSTCVPSPFLLLPYARFQCPLLGRKQTFPRFTHRSALDPGCVKTPSML